MKSSTVSSNWTPRQAFILLAFSCTVSTSAVVNPECSRPEIKSKIPTPSVYLQAVTADVTVYHCLYNEEFICDKDICSNCSMGIPNYTVAKNFTKQYSDVTRNCPKAFSGNVFTDRYGSSYRNHTPYAISYDCDKDASLRRTITVTLSKYDTKADLARDRIKLRSGTTCKYSRGFCHDHKENLNALWAAKNYTATSCGRFRKIAVSDAYYFTLGRRTYAIIDLNDKYFALELKKEVNMCGVPARETRQEGVVVTERTIEVSNASPYQVTDYFNYSNREDVYASLVEKCFADLAEDRRDDATFEKLETRHREYYVNKLSDEYKQLQIQSGVSFYLSAFSAFCCLCAMLYFVHGFCVKRKCFFYCTISNSCTSTPKTSDAEADYESVTGQA